MSLKRKNDAFRHTTSLPLCVCVSACILQKVQRIFHQMIEHQHLAFYIISWLHMASELSPSSSASLRWPIRLPDCLAAIYLPCDICAIHFDVNLFFDFAHIFNANTQTQAHAVMLALIHGCMDTHLR